MSLGIPTRMHAATQCRASMRTRGVSHHATGCAATRMALLWRIGRAVGDAWHAVPWHRARRGGRYGGSPVADVPWHSDTHARCHAMPCLHAHPWRVTPHHGPCCHACGVALTHRPRLRQRVACGAMEPWRGLWRFGGSAVADVPWHTDAHARCHAMPCLHAHPWRVAPRHGLCCHAHGDALAHRTRLTPRVA